VGFFGNLVKMPFKAVADIGKGVFNVAAGTLKGAFHVAKIGLDIATLGIAGNPLTDAKKTFADAGQVLKGVGEGVRGGIGIAGTGAAVLLAPTGLGALATYAGTDAAYTMLGG